MKKVDKPLYRRPPNSHPTAGRQKRAQTAGTAGPSRQHRSDAPPTNRNSKQSNPFAFRVRVRVRRFSTTDKFHPNKYSSSGGISELLQSKPTQNKTHPLFMALTALMTGLSGSTPSRASCNESSGRLLTTQTALSRVSASTSGGLSGCSIGGNCEL